MRFPSSHRWTLLFSSKFQLLSKKSLLQSFFEWKLPVQSCSYIIPLSIDAFGRRPHLPEICAQSDPPPSKNADFDRFRLIVPQPWDLARKVQLSLIASPLRAFHRAIDEPCALLLSPLNGGSKRKIFIFGVVSHFFVAGNRRHFKLNMWVEHTKSQPTDDKTSLKWAWPRHVTHF